MDDIKALLIAPYTWLFTVGVSAFLGVWWAKLTPTTTNATLIFGVVTITASVFWQPWISAQPIAIRVTWAIAVCSVLALVAYYLFWTTVIPLGLRATTTGADQPAGVRIGGIDWKPCYADVRLFISNRSPINYRDIDLIAKLDTPVATAEQVTNIDGVSIRFQNRPTANPALIEVESGTMRRFAIDIVPLASTTGTRIRCEFLPRNSHLEIVFASVSVRDAPTQVPIDMLFKLDFSDKSAFWFAHRGYSDRVFDSKPRVGRIDIEGQYMAGEQKVKVKRTLSAIDHIAGVLSKSRS